MSELNFDDHRGTAGGGREEEFADTVVIKANILDALGAFLILITPRMGRPGRKGVGNSINSDIQSQAGRRALSVSCPRGCKLIDSFSLSAAASGFVCWPSRSILSEIRKCESNRRGL